VRQILIPERRGRHYSKKKEKKKKGQAYGHTAVRLPEKNPGYPTI
jgi:hypothetical protein